ncbi:MAG: aminotransferase class IV [Nitrospinota bacterium]|nr:aminotransferase class IV [Nitrospinota bacterium]
MPADRYVYLDGEIIEESKALISPFDRGFLWGDGVYEVTPCFNGKLFRLDEHLKRLYRSLKYTQIQCHLDLEEMKIATHETLKVNQILLEKGKMYRVGHWVTRGMDDPSMIASKAERPTIFIFWRESPSGQLLEEYSKGVKLSIVATRRVPPQCLEARAKVTSKMNQILAELDASSNGSLSLMLDIYGNVAENSVANFFMVKDNTLYTPLEKNVLQGVTRLTVFEMAKRLGICLEEKDITLYDLSQADEYFLTSSAICAMPVNQIDRFLPKNPIPGPITEKIINEFVSETGFDFRNLSA